MNSLNIGFYPYFYIADLGSFCISLIISEYAGIKINRVIIKDFKNINKGDHILISNSNETLEAEAIKVKNDKGE